MHHIPCVIFAGGKSSRMGRDKARLPFGGFQTLTEYQIAKFSPYFENIYVGCKSKTKFHFEANFIEDAARYEDSAPHVGLISAFETLQSEAIFVLSVDAPFFEISHFEKLYDAMKDHDGVVAQSPSGDQPLCAIYRRAILPKLLQLTDEKRYRFADLYAHINVHFVPFDEESPFTNLNFPQEYEKANRL